MMSLGFLYCWLGTVFARCSDVSIADFEHVNANCEANNQFKWFKLKGNLSELNTDQVFDRVLTVKLFLHCVEKIVKH